MAVEDDAVIAIAQEFIDDPNLNQAIKDNLGGATTVAWFDNGTPLDSAHALRVLIRGIINHFSLAQGAFAASLADQYHQLPSVDPASTDVLPIEDASDSWAKKQVSLAKIISTTIAAQYNGLAAITPTLSDVLALEDQSDGYAKKKVTLEDLAALLAGGSASVTTLVDSISATGDRNIFDDSSYTTFVENMDWKRNASDAGGVTFDYTTGRITVASGGRYRVNVVGLFLVASTTQFAYEVRKNGSAVIYTTQSFVSSLADPAERSINFIHEFTAGDTISVHANPSSAAITFMAGSTFNVASSG